MTEIAEWVEGTRYSTGDKVKYGGATWTVKKLVDGTNHVPGTACCWTQEGTPYPSPFFVWHAYHEGVVARYEALSDYSYRLSELRNGLKPQHETPTRLALIRPIIDQARAKALWGDSGDSVNLSKDSEFRAFHDEECNCSDYSFSGRTILFPPEAPQKVEFLDRPANRTNSYIVDLDGDDNKADSAAEAERFIKEAVDEGADESTISVYELVQRTVDITKDITANIR